MRSPPTVFVVDDDEPVRESIEIFLRLHGILVRTFSSAEAFLNLYSESWTGCLVVDLRMPGMSGLELLEVLHRRRIVLPTVVMTGHGDGEMLEQKLIDPDDVLLKPFSANQFKEILERQLSKCVSGNEPGVEA